MSQPLLEASAEDREVVRLRREIAGLEQELQSAKDEAAQAKQALQDSAHVIRMFRKYFEPYHQFFKTLFGEITRVEAVASVAAPENSSGLSPKWEMMKSKLGHREASIIDLLQHGPMTAAQLRAASHWDIKTVYRVTQKMKQASLLENSGGKFSLRQL